MPYFTVPFRVSAAQLPTVIQVVSQEVSCLKVEQEGDGVVRTTTKKAIAARGSKTEKFVRGAMVANVTYTLGDIGVLLEGEGWSASSASPLMGKLISRGLVTRTGAGTFTRVAEVSE
jgi:hypothetical protein